MCFSMLHKQMELDNACIYLTSRSCIHATHNISHSIKQALSNEMMRNHMVINEKFKSLVDDFEITSSLRASDDIFITCQ